MHFLFILYDFTTTALQNLKEELNNSKKFSIETEIVSFITIAIVDSVEKSNQLENMEENVICIQKGLNYNFDKFNVKIIPIFLSLLS